ncbi:MAG: putative toxin-antitoxin system toxin component, PIN family [Planctomycetes bacterium]|nr:putative toxin-antitoxin system toxin component, PIN family [Planctomycetota bacterium]
MTQRIVLDTNVLVAAAYAPASASRRIVAACLAAEFLPVASLAIRREYEHILARAVRVEGYRDRLRELLDKLELVEPSETPRLVPDDPDDDKFPAAAVAGQAGWIITSDHHLLGLDPYGPIRIVPAGQFAKLIWGA